MIMLQPRPSDNDPAPATIVIQTVHGNRMSVSIDHLPYAARNRSPVTAASSGQATESAPAGSAK